MTATPFLRSLTAEEHSLLAAACEVLDLPARTKICRQGGAAVYIYFLLDGKVSLTYKPYDGPPINLIQLHPGDVFGWSSVIGNPTYASDAISGSPVHALRIRGTALRALCTQHPRTGREILEKLATAVTPRWIDARSQVQNILQRVLLLPSP